MKPSIELCGFQPGQYSGRVDLFCNVTDFERPRPTAFEAAKAAVRAEQVGVVMDGRLLNIRKVWWGDCGCNDFIVEVSEGHRYRIGFFELLPFVGPLGAPDEDTE